MDSERSNLIYWAPRIFGLIFTFFLSLLSLDVFNQNLDFGETFAAMLIHLIPFFLLAITLAIAWKNERIGALIYFFLAVVYIVWTLGNIHWSAHFLITLPLILLGTMFLFNWSHKVNEA